MIYTVEISNGYIGCELYYLCHENDYLEDLCYTDDIIQELLLCQISPYIEELTEGYDGVMTEETYLMEIICESIEFIKTPSTLNDMNNLDLIPESCIIEESDDYILYKFHLLREIEIDKLLKN